MIIASIITSIISPFAKIFGWLLAAFYSISGSYGISIILLTLLTMIVVFPLTRKGTRSMMQMQLLQPELLKMRNKYKKKPGMSAEERRELTTKQQEEMMALYRENGVSPTGGCLPMFLQFPVFIVLYDTIRGLTTTATVGRGKAAHIISRPQYINPHTGLYKSLIHSGGKMDAFGLNLADSVRSHQAHWIDVIPYVVVILIAVGLQYVSIWQITNRNPQAGANQQMQQIQKFMPLIFVFIYIEFPAGVGLYFIVSSMFRIGQQEWMYKRDPHILESISKLKEMKLKNPPPLVASPKGWRQRLAALAPQVDTSLEPAASSKSASGKPIRKPTQGSRPPRPSAARGSRPGSGPRQAQGSKPVVSKSNPARPRPGPSQQERKKPSTPSGNSQGRSRTDAVGGEAAPQATKNGINPTTTVSEAKDSNRTPPPIRAASTDGSRRHGRPR